MHIWDCHFEWVKDRKMVKCLHCPHRSDKLSELSWHVSVCHLLTHDYLEKGYFFCCFGCNKQFHDVEAFKQHKQKYDCEQKTYNVYRNIEPKNCDVTKNQINHTKGNTCLLQKTTKFGMHSRQNKCIQNTTTEQKQAENKQKKIVRFLSERKHPSSYAFAFKKNKNLGTGKEKLRRSEQTFWEKYC